MGEVFGSRGECFGYYASDFAIEGVGDAFPSNGAPARFVKEQVRNLSLTNFKPELNTASYVNVLQEPEEAEVALQGLRCNIADQTTYPGSIRLHNKALNMVADLWHCPKPPSFDAFGCYAGACTVGSTEACLLAGIAFKMRWRKWYAARHGLSEREVRREQPNLVISSLFQAAWEKLFKYFDVEPKFVSASIDKMEMCPEATKAAIDDHTIGVVCILGNHYTGHYDPVAAVGKAVEAVNAAHGFQVGIHVDAASGGFVAPFQPTEETGICDFRVPTVLSMSASGHKFGQSCIGTGWIVWRDRKDLSEHVAISVSYLGGKADSYTLNFSRPASGVSVQMYKFLRLGREGYARLCHNMLSNAEHIRQGLAAFTHGASGKPVFKILDHGCTGCLPVVTAMFNQELMLPYDSIDLQHILAEYQWFVGGYKMAFTDPLTDQTLPLFTDAHEETTMFRIVVKANLSRDLATALIRAIAKALAFLDSVNAGFAAMHEKKMAQHHRNQPC